MDKRTALLRLLAGIDQSMAKVDEILEEDDVDEEDFERVVDVVADLRDCEIRAQAALRLLRK